MKARVSRLRLPAERRILVISDIHGNLPYLKGLLEKAGFSEEDVLIILGDMVEKGPQSLATLRYIMELRRRFTVYAVCGNCDDWHPVIDAPASHLDEGLRDYLLGRSGGWGEGLVAQMCREAGEPLTEDTDMARLRSMLRERFKPELDFLRELPTIIDTPSYTFVHGGLPPGPMEEQEAWSCMKNDNFMNQGLSFDKWVIVGHWPVVLYHRDRPCANPIIDKDSRIISIDGGCVLKDDGQLNALVIPRDGSEDFGLVAYDPFPVRRVKSAQKESAKSAYIRWGDNRVRVLERGPEFSRCRHIRTGYEMDILTKYLYGQGRECDCNDSTDYVPHLSPGDEVSVVEETSRGWLVKHKGVSGWYFGQLE